jgi:hypothetical protein
MKNLNSRLLLKNEIYKMKKDNNYQKISELESKINLLTDKIDRDRINYLKLVQAKPLHF